MTGLLDHRVEQAVVAAALGRAVLLARAAATMAAAAVGLLLVTRPVLVVGLLVLLAVSAAAQIGVLTRWPRVVEAPVAVLAVDWLLLLAVLALSRGSVAYFVYAAGSAALAGVLLDLRAIPLWAVQAGQGFVVGAAVLHSTHPADPIATFVLAWPVAGILAGVGAALAGRGMARQMRLTVTLIASAQRAAAAVERARLARELHDSVAKTLRGMSLAAVALPASLRRQPRLAEQLADAISQGAATAAREARELLDGLRLDAPDQDFARTLDRLGQAWSAGTGIPVRTRLDEVDLPVSVRYELARIAHEALTNVDSHAGATVVTVVLARRRDGLTLSVHDDGKGFAVPEDLTVLQDRGHLGLVGMTERARAVGAVMELRSAPGAGTTVRVTLPAGAV